MHFPTIGLQYKTTNKHNFASQVLRSRSIDLKAASATTKVLKNVKNAKNLEN